MNGQEYVKMIYNRIKTYAAVMLMSLLTASCGFLKEMATLRKCEFRMMQK